MIYCNEMETKTDMTPSVPVEQNTVKKLMVQTYQMLDSAVATADAIRNSIRTPIPKEGEERPSVNCMMDAKQRRIHTPYVCMARRNGNN